MSSGAKRLFWRNMEQEKKETEGRIRKSAFSALDREISRAFQDISEDPDTVRRVNIVLKVNIENLDGAGFDCSFSTQQLSNCEHGGFKPQALATGA